MISFSEFSANVFGSSNTGRTTPIVTGLTTALDILTCGSRTPNFSHNRANITVTDGDRTAFLAPLASVRAARRADTSDYLHK